MKTDIWDNYHEMSLGDIRIIHPDNNSLERLVRVPGGWIYTYADMQGVSSVFIPNKK